MKNMIQELKQKLAALNKKRITDSSRTPSAVILPIFCNQNEYYILFTKRTNTVKDHKGQVSFPGGHYENYDKTLLDTALRECHEEIGMPADKISILGELDDYVTITSNFVISVFVGLIPYPFEFKSDPCEIDRLIEAPVSALLNSRQPDSGVYKGLSYRYGNDVIWGATARILQQFLDIWAQINK